MMTKPEEDELMYLRYVYENLDLGPAQEVVLEMIRDEYEGNIPDGY